jgi:hypothetical protein
MNSEADVNDDEEDEEFKIKLEAKSVLAYGGTSTLTVPCNFANGEEG